jgi:hypothetical protein
MQILTFIIWRKFHGYQGVEVLGAFREQVVPSSNQAAFVLVVNQIEGIVGPGFPNLLDVFF